jgi:ATP-dependent DNA helicase RecQ
LLTYFGEEYPEPCGACDVCLGRHDPPAVTAAQEEQLRRILEKVRADVPRGDWFAQSEVPRHEVDVLVNWLVQRGYIRMADPLNGRFVLTDAGHDQVA